MKDLKSLFVKTLFSVLLLTGVLFVFAPFAEAGEYHVANCGLGNTNAYLSTNITNNHLNVVDGCNTPSTAWPGYSNGTGTLYTLGFFLRPQSGSVAPRNTTATATWRAPKGTIIKSASAYFRSKTVIKNGWRVQVVVTNKQGKKTVDKNMCSDSSCTADNKLSQSSWVKKITNPGFSFIRYQIQLICIRSAGCSKSPSIDLSASSFAFTLGDSTPPYVIADVQDNLALKNMLDGAWIKGSDLPDSFKLITYDVGSGVLLYNAAFNNASIGAAFLCSAEVKKSDAFKPGVNIFSSFFPCAGLHSPEINLGRLKNISAEGTYPLAFCSVDVSGNRACLDKPAKIDNKAPTLSAFPDPASVNTSFLVNAQADDFGSGLKSVEYRVGEYQDLSSVPPIVASTPICVSQQTASSCKLDLSSYDQKKIAIFIKTTDDVGNTNGLMLLGPSKDGIRVDKNIPPEDNLPKPKLSFTSLPPKITNSKQAVFRFSTNNAILKCSIDAQPFESCSSPHKIVVGNGAHLFQVRAISLEAGTIQTISYRWRVDSANKLCRLQRFSNPVVRFKGKNRRQVIIRLKYRASAPTKARLVFQKGQRTIALFPFKLKKAGVLKITRKANKKLRTAKKKNLRAKIVISGTPNYCRSVLKKKRVR